jgi:hypothetical protein
MSLRDFNTPASDDPIALHNEPLGNGAGLSDFHTVNVEESERSNTPKIVGAVAVALMVGAAAVGLYAYSGPSTKPVVADNTLPKTAPVAPPPQQTAMAQDNSASAPAPQSAAPTPPPAATPSPAATTEPATPAPVHTASRSSHRIKSASASEPASDAASVRMSADTTQATQAPREAQVTPQPAQQAQATPLPAAPTPSPSDVASNGGQSSAAVPNNATTASDIPQAAPAPAQPPAPAQTTQPDTTPAPAPAQ